MDRQNKVRTSQSHNYNGPNIQIVNLQAQLKNNSNSKLTKL